MYKESFVTQNVRHNAFSRKPRYKSTVLPRSLSIPKKELGSSTAGTMLDFLHINLLYCGGRVLTSMHFELISLSVIIDDIVIVIHSN